jgi:tRNA (cmo5U34)-methyltransferase
MSIDQAFNDSVAYYDDWMKKALPNYDALFGTALELIPYDVQTRIHVLDLGAGTGLFSEHVLRKYPEASFVLSDVADKMLDVARIRFAGQAAQFNYVLQDYRDLKGVGVYDLVISSLSIHHLTDEEKQALFGRIFRVLKAGGIFINIDQIRGETDAIRELYWKHWLEQVRSAGCAKERIQESINRRTTYDKDASMQDQLSWLKEVGFTHVDCVFKAYFVGVFLATKA